MNPPPIPQQPAPKKSSAHQAATAGLVAPLIVILLNAALLATTQSTSGSPSAKRIIGGISLLLIVAGFSFGIFALAGIRRHGAQGILGRGIAGITLNGVLVLVFIAGFLAGINKGIKRAKAKRDMDLAVKDLQNDVRKAFDPKQGITNANREGVEQFRRKLEAASTNLSGADAIISKASLAHIDRMQTASREFEKVMIELKNAQILSFGSVTKQDQLQSRREIVQRFAEANQKLTATITNAESFYHADLQRLGAPPAAIEEALRGFRKAAAFKNALLLDIRNCDARMATAMLGVLDLLETNWGDWNVNFSSGKVIFDKTGLVGPYNEFIQEIQSASQDQIRAQRKLVNSATN